mgnify:CR=1 FL=1
MKYLFALACLIFSFPALAQERMCTQIGCMNGVNFTVDPNRDWKNGQYEVHVALDLKTVVCRGELPLHPCDQGPTFRCDDPDVTVMESGCALPDNNHGIGGIMINDDPQKIIVRLTRNYRTILTRTIVPQYQTSMPNGPGCGPVCRGASFDLFSAEKR